MTWGTALRRAVVLTFTLLAVDVEDGTWAADPYVIAVDVPAALSGTQVAPGQIALNQDNAYSIVSTFAPLGAYQGPIGGVSYLAFSQPTFVNVWMEPRDIVATDGTSFAIVLEGASVGIPPGVSIDALAVDGSDYLLSFDIPVQFGGTWYRPSDVLRYSAGVFSLAYDGASRGIPEGANIVGLDIDMNGPVLSFDVPVTLNATTFLPGSLVSDDGATFTIKSMDPLWPAGVQLRDFSLAAGAGSVSDSGSASISIDHSVTTNLVTLSWGASCASSDSDYEVYEGAIPANGAFAYNHGSKFCSTGGQTTITFSPPVGSAYYIVVPHNGVFEGSYGSSSAGAPRPQGVPSCRPQKVAVTCQ